MATLDLQPEYQHLLGQIMAQYAPAAELWAYGSRVRGTGHAGSDLDLVLRTPGQLPTPHPGFAQLHAALAESNLPILIDLHDWAVLTPAMRRVIARGHVVVYAPSADAPRRPARRVRAAAIR